MAGSIKAIDGIGRAFDYSALPKEVAGEAQRVAIMVRSRHKEQIKAVVETGRDLATVKATIGHGNFTPWLEAEFGWSERTAQNYMAAAAAFEGKTAIVADLPLTTVYSLAASSTPEPVRAEIVQRIEAGERLGDGEIRGMISDAKRGAKAAQAAAKLTPKQMNRERQRRARQQSEWAKRQAEMVAERERENTARQRVAAMLVEGFRDNLETLETLLEQASETSLLMAIRKAQA